MQVLLASQAAAFMRGDFEFLVPHYSIPFVIHIEERLAHFRSHAALQSGLASYRQFLLGTGLTDLEPRVKMADLPRDGRFRAWVDIWFTYGDTERRESTSSIFYAREAPEGLQIEMVQFTSFPHPQIKAQLPEVI